MAKKKKFSRFAIFIIPKLLPFLALFLGNGMLVQALSPLR